MEKYLPLSFDAVKRMTGKEFNTYIQKLFDSYEDKRQRIKDYHYCTNLIKQINQLINEKH